MCDPVKFYADLYAEPPMPICLIDFPVYIQKMAHTVMILGHKDYRPISHYLNHISEPGTYGVKQKLLFLNRILRIINVFKTYDKDTKSLDKLQKRTIAIITFYRPL